MGLELWQLHEDEVKPVDYAVGVLHVHQAVIMVALVAQAGLKDVVDKVERVHRLEQVVVLAAPELAHICLRGVEEHTLLELGRPHHLHLHDELAAAVVAAAHVDYAVLAQRCLRHKLRRKVLNGCYLVAGMVERQQRVEETHHQVGMLSEHFLEGQVGLGVEVSHRSLSL